MRGLYVSFVFLSALHVAAGCYLGRIETSLGPVTLYDLYTIKPVIFTQTQNDSFTIFMKTDCLYKMYGVSILYNGDTVFKSTDHRTSMGVRLPQKAGKYDVHSNHERYRGPYLAQFEIISNFNPYTSPDTTTIDPTENPAHNLPLANLDAEIRIRIDKEYLRISCDASVLSEISLHDLNGMVLAQTHPGTNSQEFMLTEQFPTFLIVFVQTSSGVQIRKKIVLPLN